MKATDVKSLTDAELTVKEGVLREELYGLRFKKHTGELTNMALIRKTKKDLARVLTEARARKTANQGGSK